MITELNEQYSDWLNKIAETLDISDAMFLKAKDRYEAVGKHLATDPNLKEAKPEISVQGSFLLGTVVRPDSEKDEYDIDLICELQFKRREISQKGVKEAVGESLNRSPHYRKMLEREYDHCWTLQYSDDMDFKMDIVPAIPDKEFFKARLLKEGHKRFYDSEQYSDTSIAITDINRHNYPIVDDDWITTNPKGYAKWFREQMETAFIKRRTFLAESKKAHIDDIQDYEVKTPLQRVVQILKRHRNKSFETRQDFQPSSIVITTLAAHAYNEEENLFEALVNIVNSMEHYIEDRAGELWVENPVNPIENFAKSWNKNRDLYENFSIWMASLKKFVGELQSGEGGVKKINESFRVSFGVKVVDSVFEKSGFGVVKRLERDTVVHAKKEKPKWPIREKFGVSMNAYIIGNGFRRDKLYYGSFSSSLPKGVKIHFRANTNVPEPYEVYWQVLNTGYEAEEANGVRGDIFKGDVLREEKTLYRGRHTIECYIVQGGVCVAHSDEFVVKIN